MSSTALSSAGGAAGRASGAAALAEVDDGFGSDVDAYVDDDLTASAATPLPQASPGRWAGPSSSISSPATGRLSSAPAVSLTAGGGAGAADRESVRRDKERLQRFANEAGRFLDAAYDNDEGVIVQDGRVEGQKTVDDFKAKRRVELDKARLERFSHEAEAFIDVAYGEDSSGFVEEEMLSPRSTKKGLGSGGVEREKERLERFHTEAMTFLDASVDPSTVYSGMPDSSSDNGARVKREPGKAGVDESMVARVEKDKEQLEMHYRDAMAFLERAEAGEGIIEECELETGELDRVRLKTYATEAMNFLENAFAVDGGSSARMAGSDAREKSAIQVAQGGMTPRARAAARNRNTKEVIDGMHDTAVSSRKRRLGTVGAEAWQIAEDRRAMERYYDEDDSFGNVGVVEVSLGGAVSDASDAKSDVLEDDDDWGGIDVTDDDDDGPNDQHAVGVTVAGFGLAGLQSGDGRDDSVVDRAGPSAVVFEDQVSSDNSSGDYKMQVVHEDGYAHSREDSKVLAERRGLSNVSVPLSLQPAVPSTLAAAEKDQSRDSGGRGIRLDDRQDPTDVGYGPPSCDEPPSLYEPFSSEALASIASQECPVLPPSPLPEDCLVGLLMEGGADSNPEWSDVPLLQSFYRTLPRGATIKLRSGPSAVNLDEAASVEAGSVGGVASAGGSVKSGNALARVEQERDVLMTNLEEIINERSRMAVQIAEMKRTVLATFGRSKSLEIEANGGDVDVVADLTEAYDEFNLVIKESEATVSVLEGHIAEGQKHLQELEAEREVSLAQIASLQRKLEDRGAREIAMRATASDDAGIELRRELSTVRAEAREEQLAAERRRRESDAETDRVKAELRRVEEVLSTETEARRDAEKKQAGSVVDLSSLQRELADVKALRQDEEKRAERRLRDAEGETSRLDSELKRMEKAVGEEDEARIELNRVEGLLMQEKKARREADERADEAERKEKVAASGGVGGGSSFNDSSHMWEQMNAAREEADEARKGQERAERQLKETQTGPQRIGRNISAGTVGSDGKVSELKDQLQLEKRHRETEAAEHRAEMDRLELALRLNQPSGETDTERGLKEELSQLMRQVSRAQSTIELLETERNAALGAKKNADGEADQLRRSLEVKRNVNTGSEVTALQAEVYGLREEMDLRERQLLLQVEDSTSLLASCEAQISILRRELIEVQQQGERAIESERRSRRNAESQQAKMEQEIKAARRARSSTKVETDRVASDRSRNNTAVHREGSESFDVPGLVKSLSKRGFGLRKAKTGKKDKEREAGGSGSTFESKSSSSRGRKD